MEQPAGLKSGRGQGSNQQAVQEKMLALAAQEKMVLALALHKNQLVRYGCICDAAMGGSPPFALMERGRYGTLVSPGHWAQSHIATTSSMAMNCMRNPNLEGMLARVCLIGGPPIGHLGEIAH